MTKPISRKMAVDCLLHMAMTPGAMVCDFSTDDNKLSVVYYFKCIECDEPILHGQAIQFDHRHAIVHDGPHDYKNLRPIHSSCHKQKSAKDVAANAKVKRIQAGGRKKRGPRLQSRGFQQASRPFPKRRKPSAS